MMRDTRSWSAIEWTVSGGQRDDTNELIAVVVCNRTRLAGESTRVRYIHEIHQAAEDFWISNIRDL